MPVEPNLHLFNVAPPVHGGATPADWQRAGGRLLDFSVNSNPFGPSPLVVEALSTVDLTRYPDPECTELRAAIAARDGVEPDAVLAGNGSVELMFLAAHAYLRPGDRALVFGPTFGEYARAAMVAGAEVMEASAGAADGYRFNGHAMDAAIGHFAPRLAFICNPNNPTGAYIPGASLRALAVRHPDVLFVVDEAYLPFVAGGDSFAGPHPLANAVVLRSLTKDCAVPALRLGYALARPELLDPMRTGQPTWSVNAMAQAAGIAGMADTHHWQQSLAGLRDAKAYLMATLPAIHGEVLPSDANFFLWRVNGASGWRHALLQRGCLVRNCLSFGLRGYLRVSVRTPAECERLVAAAAEVAALGATSD